MAFKPFNPDAEWRVHRQNLPHWRQWGTTYFITSRLADSVPARVAADWRRKRQVWLRTRGLDSADDLCKLTDAEHREYHREFTATFHELIDAGHGACVLADPRCAGHLISRLIAGHGTGYQLDAWCIMPNHLHALVEPAKQVTLGEIVRHWKGGSAFDINRTLARRGKLWQPEPFDHIVRSEAQLEHFRRYIAGNPVKAGLREGYVVGFAGDVGGSGKCVMGLSS